MIAAGNVPEVYRVDGKNIKKWDTSSRVILSLRLSEGLVLACGSDALIDIFSNASRLCSLTIL